MDTCYYRNIGFLLLISSSILGVHLDSLSFSVGVSNINRVIDNYIIGCSCAVFWGVISCNLIEGIKVF